MKRLLVRLNFAFCRFLCYFFGHRNIQQRDGVTVMTYCARCYQLGAIDLIKYTARRKVTHGDIERRMRDNPPEGYEFVSCNWKKRKAKFVNKNGKHSFVTF